MTEKPLPTAEEFYLSHKSSDNNMPLQKKVAECINAYASLHTEQALREFADGMIAFADNVRDRQAVISAAESLRDQLLNEIKIK